VKNLTGVLVLVLLGIAANAQIKQDSLILFYPFSGNTLDASGNGHNGTNIGATLTTDRFFKTDSAYNFDGTNDYIKIPHSTATKPGFPASVSLWVYIDSYDQYFTTLFSNCGDALNYAGYYLKYSSTGLFEASYGAGMSGTSSANRRSLETNFKLETGRWYHIATNFNGLNDIEIYINGNLISGNYTGAANTMMNNTSDGAIGKAIGTLGNVFHDGKIDDVRFYSDSLTVKDVRYLCYTGPCTSNITIYDTVAVTVYDSISVTDTLVVTVPLGLPTNYVNTIKVYPNPASTVLIIDMGIYYQSMTAQTIQITNTLGQVVFNQGVQDPQFVIDLTTTMTAKGVYFFNVLNSGGQIIDTRKIVIQ